MRLNLQARTAQYLREVLALTQRLGWSLSIRAPIVAS